jgi:hypothetical protein
MISIVLRGKPAASLARLRRIAHDSPDSNPDA